MTNTTVNADLQVKKYLSDFFMEYVRNNRFSRYTGTSNNNIITIKEGKQIINVPLVTKLDGNGVSGSSTLRGNAEKINNYAFNLTPTYYRNAVEMTKEEKDKPAFDLMQAARSLLMEWSKEKVRDDIIQAMGAIVAGSSYADYGTATDANMNTWNTNNQDRILYGSAKSNLTAGDHSASLGNIDTTNDKLDKEMVSLAKRLAQQSSPKIRPLKSTEDEEMYVMFADPYAFRDLKDDLATTNRDAGIRGDKNRLFAGGDLYYDNVVIREIPEIADFIDGTTGSNGAWGGGATTNGLNTAGASSSRVGVAFLCGQQAVGYGLGQRPDVVVDREYDYGFQPGVAVELKHQIRKANFNSVQHGIVTVFCSAAADS